MLTLRPYQSAAVSKAREAIRSGKRAPLIVAPCGAGKSVIGAAIGLGTVERGNVALWLANRKELKDQARDHLRRAGVPSDAPIAVESYQTLIARPVETWPAAKLLICDECHHLAKSAPEWFRVIDHYREQGAVRIGLTATPCRGDGAPLQGAFDCIIPVASVRELQALGFLVPYQVFGPDSRRQAMALHPVDALMKYAPCGRALVFARDVAHARKLAGEFTARGFPAACVEGKMADREKGTGIATARDAAFARFKAGDLQVLTGVHVFTEGTDIPTADVAILARGVGHAGAYIQAVSRVGRPSPGKTAGIVLDLLGCSHECGLPDDDRVYSLDGKPISGGAGIEALRQCPACGGCFRAAEFLEAVCPRCGYRVPGRPDPAIRAAAIGRILEGHTVDQRARKWAELCETAKAKGYKPGWAFFQWKLRYGGMPPRTGATT